MKTLLAVALLAGVVGCRGWVSEDPPVHLNWNMDTQEKGKAYRHSEHFADGRYMRTPPAGTVAQGWLKEDDHLSLGLAEDGKLAMALPPSFVGGEEAVRRGQQRYGIYCSPCHGFAGDGAGTVAARMTVKPPSFHDARLKDMPIGQIYRAILNGVNNGNMGSYAAQIEENDRWNVVLYVRALQRSKDPAVTLSGKVEGPIDPNAGPAEKGKALYSSKGCNACHSLDGTRVLGPTWKGLYGVKEKTNKGEITVDDAYLIESMKEPMAQITDSYPPVMPAVFGTPAAPLTDDEIASLIAFIKSLK
ncbi:MAG: c-type cytochrome [Deltaproteobacteria bacterium]|nr:c-type cytochrome [Deltaproteobacteria bacterium]